MRLEVRASQLASNSSRSLAGTVTSQLSRTQALCRRLRPVSATMLPFPIALLPNHDSYVGRGSPNNQSEQVRCERAGGFAARHVTCLLRARALIGGEF